MPCQQGSTKPPKPDAWRMRVCNICGAKRSNAALTPLRPRLFEVLVAVLVHAHQLGGLAKRRARAVLEERLRQVAVDQLHTEGQSMRS